MSRFKEHYGSMTIWELEQEVEALKAELATRYLPLKQCLENAEETRATIAQDVFSRPGARDAIIEECASLLDAIYSQGPQRGTVVWGQAWGSGVLDAAAAIRSLKAGT